MGSRAGLAIRAALIALCLFASWRSALIARADRKPDLIELGQQRELAGDVAGAAQFLSLAAERDHTWRPGWAWASFCERNNRPDEALRAVQHLLGLDPLGYDPTPAFDLAWRLTPGQALNLIPRSGPRPQQYLDYLVRTNRLDAALEALPIVLNATPDPAGLAAFDDALLKDGRIEASIAVWNQLVARFPEARGPFAWAPSTPTASLSHGTLRVELRGESESLSIATKAAILTAGRHRLLWKPDSSRLALSTDPGFAFDVSLADGTLLASCPTLAASSSCEFTSPSGVSTLRLRYSRAPGTVPARGELTLTEVRLT